MIVAILLRVVALAKIAAVKILKKYHSF